MNPAMTPAEARAELGVDATADRGAIRAAFRAQIGRHHPDLNPDRDTSARAVRLIRAWEVLSVLADPPAAPTPPGRRRRAGDRERRSGDANPPPADPQPGRGAGGGGGAPADGADAHAGTNPVGSRGAAWASEGSVLVAAPWEETMLWLVDAAHRVGDVTFLDPSSGLVEALVEFVDGPTVTLIMSLQGRAALAPDGTSGTEVWISMEPWSTPPRPDLPEDGKPATFTEAPAHCVLLFRSLTGKPKGV